MLHPAASFHLTRRGFLRLAGMTAGAAALVACTGQLPVAPAAAPAATGPLFAGADFINNKDQWSRLPADHVPGTPISQAQWYEILGEAPAEPIEMVGFKGGFGDAYADLIIDLMKKEHPGIQVNKDFDPTIWDKVQPRLVSGDIPDWMFYALGAWGGDWQKAVDEHLVAPGDFLLDVESYGFSGETVGNIMFPGALTAANSGLTEHTWTFPQTQFAYGIFYNADLFEQNGWPAPDSLTWEEFMELQAEIAKVTPPWTYAGQYPGYFLMMGSGLLWKAVGVEGYCDMNNLVPGAFQNEKFIWGIKELQKIFANGWIYPGSEAMSHTESQQMFVDGKVAMIPNGTWMESEQASTTPEGFRMKFSSAPAPKDSTVFPYALEVALGCSDMQIGNGQNPLWGMELMRMFYSADNARFWAEEIASPLPIKNAMMGATPSDALASVVEAINKAEGHYVQSYWGSYPLLGKTWGDSMGDLLWGKMSAEEMAANLERAAEETRNDDTITKRTYECKP